ncbi:hypothetical protein BO443_140101 [Burkholderia orbicola]
MADGPTDFLAAHSEHFVYGNLGRHAQAVLLGWDNSNAYQGRIDH